MNESKGGFELISDMNWSDIELVVGEELNNALGNDVYFDVLKDKYRTDREEINMPFWISFNDEKFPFRHLKGNFRANPKKLDHVWVSILKPGEYVYTDLGSAFNPGDIANRLIKFINEET